MVNNIGENLENMPISMRKKWDKAAYGRERFLAKEYLKHLKLKEKEEKKKLNVENLIRLYVRKLLKEEIKNVPR